MPWIFTTLLPTDVVGKSLSMPSAAEHNFCFINRIYSIGIASERSHTHARQAHTILACFVGFLCILRTAGT